jgi:PAS domain S-box-containing protein
MRESAAIQKELEALREKLAQTEALLQAAQDSAARFRLLSDNDLVGFYIIQGQIIRYLNDVVTVMLGYDLGELIGRNILEILAPECRALAAESLAKRQRGEVRSIRYMLTGLHKSGRRIEIEVYGSATLFEGKPAVCGMIVDRTEALRAERALRTSEARFQAFMDHTPTFAFMKDAEGRIVYGNRALHEILQLPPGQLAGKKTQDVFPPDTARQMADTDHQVLAERRLVEVMVSLPTPSGTRELLQFKFPVEDPSGQWLVGGVAVDVTERKQMEAVLAEKTRILEAILASMGDGVAVADEDGRFIIFNPAARRITGMDAAGTQVGDWAQGHGLFMPDRITPVPVAALPLVRAARGESTEALEFFVRDPARSEETWVQISAQPLVDDLGMLRGGVAVLRDTTERHMVLEELHKAEAKYRALVEQLPVVTYRMSTNPEDAPLYVSPQIEAKLGFTPQEWTSTPGIWLRQLHPEDRGRALEAFRQLIDSGTRRTCEYRMLARDGDIVHFRDEAVLLSNPESGPPFLQGVLLDITAQETERGIRERLRHLTMDLVAVQEAERRRIGLELHDEIGQILTGLKLRLGTAASFPEAEIRLQLAELNQLVDGATTHVRELSQSLRPAVLDDLGLLPALGSHVQHYSRQTGVQVEFEHLGIERRRFLPDFETAIYRIVQEALNNVARHANVDVVRVRVWADEDHVGVQIEDAGVGFDPDASARHDRTSTGLRGMRERAELLDGHLTVDSAPGRGCRVTCELPIPGGAERM